MEAASGLVRDLVGGQARARFATFCGRDHAEILRRFGWAAWLPRFRRQLCLPRFRQRIEKLEERLEGQAVLEKNLMIAALARRAQPDLIAVE